MFTTTRRTLLRSIKKTRIPEEIVAQIYGLVRDGALKPGDKLPPERELAQQMGVSRASVREAMRLLDQKGLIVIRPGAGTFMTEDVIETIVQAFSSLLNESGDGAGDVFEMRLLLEPHVVSLAADRASQSDIDRLREILREQKGDIAAGGTGVAYDIAFHQAIANATKNSALVAVNQAISGILSQSREDALMSPERSSKSLRSHEGILAAIESRDPHAAQMAMHQHITQIDREVHDLPGRKDR
ncbi:MAG: FadR/GntR family transcriptional regulator [SAR202 cluster bacterium]|jgi:GntR family transcriptional repressor for pyruvate dehydrogenase complex|nr:FadR/GntR family transcriptional regulator [SAR202 cluster bacterium]MDP6664571.1 FadR/GntR family transcriptional regulator [SAR202 cluster bacterium]MDP6800027.1 FadR/GntR family transcriptional regulator [SAR202 cluster bacterium]|tara:strand:+ start:6684 stop:7412 length:729 start_codon:yes stop_codon:yes gene_type:complete